MTEPEAFGRTMDGETVRRVRLSGGGLTAHVLTWGAVVQDLRLDGHQPPLVLGFDRFDDYPLHSPYFGATVGRCANRIADARFTLDGTEWELDHNFLGKHTLHGGVRGFGRRNWRIAAQATDHVTLELVSEHGDMGFPGRLVATCTYRLADGGTFALLFEAETDAPTLCNLAHHSYFNLDDGGATPILDHRLEIAADTYLVVDDDLIPTGEIAPVAGTPFDFRRARPIRHEENGTQLIYDHNWCLSPGPTEEVRPTARLEGARSGITMDVLSTEPGVQFYAGHKIAVPDPGLGGIRYQPRSGLCLEAQIWPDAIHHDDFPSAVLRPGERYRQVTEYRFARR